MLSKVLWLLERVDGATQLVNRTKEFFSLSANIIHVSRDRILKSSKKSSKRSCDGSRLEWRSGRDLLSHNLLKSHLFPQVDRKLHCFCLWWMWLKFEQKHYYKFCPILLNRTHCHDIMVKYCMCCKYTPLFKLPDWMYLNTGVNKNAIKQAIQNCLSFVDKDRVSKLCNVERNRTEYSCIWCQDDVWNFGFSDCRTGFDMSDESMEGLRGSEPESEDFLDLQLARVNNSHRQAIHRFWRLKFRYKCTGRRLKS